MEILSNTLLSMLTPSRNELSINYIKRQVNNMGLDKKKVIYVDR